MLLQRITFGDKPISVHKNTELKKMAMTKTIEALKVIILFLVTIITICRATNSPIVIVNPKEGDSIISPTVVHLSLVPEHLHVNVLDGYSVCLSTNQHVDKCVYLNLEGETVLPEMDANIGVSNISAWLKDKGGDIIGEPHKVEVNVITNKAFGMFSYGELNDSALVHKSEWFANRDNDAFIYSQNACVSNHQGGPLSFLIFSNSSDFRTARAMIHYADGLIHAGCIAHIGFVRSGTSSFDNTGAREMVGLVEKRYFTSWEDLAEKSVEYDTILFEKVQFMLSECVSSIFHISQL